MVMKKMMIRVVRKSSDQQIDLVRWEADSRGRVMRDERGGC